jgi:hypothetical protein
MATSNHTRISTTLTDVIMKRDCAQFGLVSFGRDLGTVTEPAFLQHALAGTAAAEFLIAEDTPEPVAVEPEPEPVPDEPEPFDEDIARLQADRGWRCRRSRGGIPGTQQAADRDCRG